ncbi:hypothetical protein [Cellulophaga sp. Hel_I_12]|uniref:hypothetical protein n=1 Tax=Cellulophaga sp. Hel_I_12 TaxID=1249972 RepID=UPI000648D912|nr:hypothetical protein [Cellulophaga sp. Hel_I_12]
MVKQVVLFSLLLLGAISCGEQKKEAIENDPTKDLVDLKKLPKKIEPSAAAMELLKDWTEYNALNGAISSFYAAETKEDVLVLVDDLIEKQKLLEASTYPLEFDRPDIKSRQKVFKTYVLKIKSNMVYDINPREAVIQAIKAYNAFNNQFSIVLSSKIDTEILFDE